MDRTVDLDDLDAAIAEYTTFPFTDSTRLPDAGLDSLSLLRLVVKVAADDDAEIDATRLIDLHTVGDLKQWLRSVAASGGTADGAAGRTGPEGST